MARPDGQRAVLSGGVRRAGLPEFSAQSLLEKLSGRPINGHGAGALCRECAKLLVHTPGVARAGAEACGNDRYRDSSTGPRFRAGLPQASECGAAPANLQPGVIGGAARFGDSLSEYVDIMDDDRRTTRAVADGETLRTFLDRGPIIAFIRDDCGRYVYVNPVMEQQFGVLAADLEGHEGGAWMPEHLARILSEHDPQMLAVGLPIEMIAAVPQADGSAQYLEDRAIPVCRTGRRSLRRWRRGERHRPARSAGAPG